MPDVLALRPGFPLRRTVQYVTRRNALDGGVEYRSYEAAAGANRWELDLRNRSTAEIGQLEDFFRARGGCYGTFVFLDPSENLLRWSEDFTQPEWEAALPAYLSVDSYVADPCGGQAAQRVWNTAAASNALEQWLEAPPGGLHFTGSVWMRADSAVQATVIVAGETGAASSTPAVVDSEWRRFAVTAQFTAGSGGQRTRFRIEWPGGRWIDLFGAQLLPLAGPGAYVRTTSASGFHPCCRFDQDSLASNATAFGAMQTRVAILECE